MLNFLFSTIFESTEFFSLIILIDFIERFTIVNIIPVTSITNFWTELFGLSWCNEIYIIRSNVFTSKSNWLGLWEMEDWSAYDRCRLINAAFAPS
jgi:hypothetical protein